MSQTHTFQLHTTRRRHGRISLTEGTAPPPVVPAHTPTPARIARLVALAHHINDLVRSGVVNDLADAARLGNVSRARVSQIVNLLNLSPSIQERLLFLDRPTTGREQIGERDLRAIAQEPDWQKQEVMFDTLLQAKGIDSTNSPTRFTH